jgi:hypothetical protein
VLINFRFYEPRQVYQQTYYSGHPAAVYFGKCCRLQIRTIRTDDLFFVENRSLFRLSESLPETLLWTDDGTKDEILVARPPRYYNDDLEDEIPIQIKDKSIAMKTWRSWLNRIQTFFNKFTNADIKNNKINDS